MAQTTGRRKVAAPLHKSIAALLEAYPEEKDAKKLIRRLAREKVALAKTRGWEGPPFCPKIFASIFDIKCRAVDHDIRGEGRILAYKDKKVRIEYRKGRMIERERFTIFHEFAHTLFPDFCEFLPRYHTPLKEISDPEKPFEHLCDLAASEMLFPMEDFERDLKVSDWPGFETVHKLRERYLASIDATIYRILSVSDKIPLGAAFLTDLRGTFHGRGPLWVKYFSGNSICKSYIPPGTIPPYNSIALDCYRQGIATTPPIKETWWIAGKPRSWLVQAAKLPTVDNVEYPKVVALFLPVSCRAAYEKTLCVPDTSDALGE
jgi:hypothetical protein